MRIKKYSHFQITVELFKYRDGYHVVEKRLNGRGELEEVFRHSKIQALDKASNLTYERVTNTIEEGLDPGEFEVWSKH